MPYALSLTIYFEWHSPNVTLQMLSVTSRFFSLLCCKTAGFGEIIELCLNSRQLFICSHSLQYFFCVLAGTYSKHNPPKIHSCLYSRVSSQTLEYNISFTIQEYPWKVKQSLRGPERILSSFQVYVSAGTQYGWTLQSHTWAGSTLWSWPNIFSGEHFLLLPNWHTSALAYKSQPKALLPMLEYEGSSDSYIWPHFVLTSWTTCKYVPSHFKLGLFYSQVKLCVFVGGQKRKLLSLVSIPRLS